MGIAGLTLSLKSQGRTKQCAPFSCFGISRTNSIALLLTGGNHPHLSRWQVTNRQTGPLQSRYCRQSAPVGQERGARGSLHHEYGVIVPVDPGFALNTFTQELWQGEHSPVGFPVVVPKRLADPPGDGRIEPRLRLVL